MEKHVAVNDSAYNTPKSVCFVKECFARIEYQWTLETKLNEVDNEVDRIDGPICEDFEIFPGHQGQEDEQNEKKKRK